MSNFNVLFLILILIFIFVDASLFDVWNSLTDHFFYKCKNDYFKKDLNGLAWNLKEYLFGQPLVSSIVLNALRGHLSKKNPSKPLTLSFHGWPGSGKNYVTDFIVKSLYSEHYKSPNVHTFVAKINFPLQSQVQQYQIDLVQKIIRSVKFCENSIFIFDEVDKYPEGVLDAVKPFLDYKISIDGIDFRKSIFIFLSNIGSNVIVERTMELWKSGKKREDFELSDFERFLSMVAFNEKGGFYRSDMIDSHLIDHFVPFLPLEEEHVRMCARTEFKKLGVSEISESAVDGVIRNLDFGPEPVSLFSVAGCKRVSQLVSVIIMRYNWNKNIKNEL
ncbi:torsin-1A-like [Lycorma delicatula]|uniref:torsin-1A-like n=1 Tax=Lycorma delicatula TaxID=130591 RepID=UPI003F51AA47